jgi:hypothetical protein
MEAYLGKTGATYLEANPEIESDAAHKEVPKEEAAAKTVGALKKRHGDRHLAVGCCRRKVPKAMVVGRRLQRNGPPCYSCTA